MKNDKHEQVLSLIEEISNSNPIMEDIFSNGSCFNFYHILAVVFPEAEAYCNISHVITKIDERYYDITGEVSDIIDYQHIDDICSFNCCNNKGNIKKKCMMYISSQKPKYIRFELVFRKKMKSKNLKIYQISND